MHVFLYMIDFIIISFIKNLSITVVKKFSKEVDIKEKG